MKRTKEALKSARLSSGSNHKQIPPVARGDPDFDGHDLPLRSPSTGAAVKFRSVHLKCGGYQP